jgi:sugar lactone lactonase YvrE
LIGLAVLLAIGFVETWNPVAAATFSDRDFPSSNWTSLIVRDPQGDSSFASTTQPGGGNPGAFRQTIQTIPGGSRSLIVDHVYSAAQYVPRDSGAIAAISVEFDLRFISGSAGTSVVNHQLVLVQEGTHYNALKSAAIATGPGNGAPGSWATFRTADLKAADFTRLSGRGPLSPDFSRGAAPIQFGYLNLNATSDAGIVTTSGIDNWLVTATSVPLPPAGEGTYPAPTTTGSVAGGGAAGTQDGTGAGARFNKPRGVAVDHSGNILVADSANHTIRRITPAGVVSTLAGLAGVEGSSDGTGSEARFSFPFGLAINSAGLIYVTDGRHTVRVVTPAGVVTTLAGSFGSTGSADGAAGAARFNSPKGIAVDRDGSLIVADAGNHTLRRITAAGVVTTFAGQVGVAGHADGPIATARFNLPGGVAIDATGQIHVADNGNFVLRRISLAGVVTTLAGAPGIPGTIDGTGNNARFEHLGGLAVEAGGTVYVTDADSNVVRRVTAAGVVSTVAGLVNRLGSENGSGPATRFNGPTGVAVSPAVDLIISDTSNHGIRQIVLNIPPPPPPPSTISNISVRTALPSGQTLIVGFTMEGGSKPVLVRAIGPGLGQFGVSGFMADPRMALFKGSDRVDLNDDWGGNAALSAAFAGVGAFAIPAASLDAALLRDIEGSHTVQVSGPPGNVLVEAYDAGTGVSRRLVNISARNRVGTGDEILIAGFTISGNLPKSLLIRAVGPTLAAFGVPATLSDPRLEIFSNSTRVAENDNWSAALAPTFARVGAFPLVAASADAALVVSLSPGSYTALVAGVGGGTGEALVELYELP